MTWVEKDSRNGRWVVRWRDPSTGKKRKSKPFKTKGAARTAQSELDVALARESVGLDDLRPNPNGWTLRDLVEWRMEKFVSTPSACNFRAWLKTDIESKLIDRIRPQDLERQFDAWADDVKPSTINRRRSALQGAFTQARRVGHWGREANPVAKTRARDERESARVREYTDAPTIGLLLEAVDPDYKGIVALAGLAGLRKGEIAALTADDIDLANGTIVIARSYGRNATKGKRRDERRMHVALAEVMREAIKRRPTGTLFPRLDGHPVTQGDHTYDKVMRDARRLANVKANITLHSLRHTFLTLLSRAGVPAREIQEHGRHSSIAMAMHYVHPDNLSRDLELIDVAPNGVVPLRRKK